MTLDLTRLLDKLNPQKDGEDTLTLRSAIVNAVNTDGTADIILSGVLVPDVPRLTGAAITEGSVVQVLSSLGQLLILGQNSEAGTAGTGLWARESETTNSSAIGTTLTTVLTTPSKTYLANRVYDVRMRGGVFTATTAASFADFRVYRTAADTLLGEYFRTPINGATNVYKAEGFGVRFTPGAVNVTAQLSLKMAHSVGTVTHYGNSGTPRWLEVWDIGDLSQFTDITVW